ncbi:4Fe-4S dicluster domain-containing protein [Candidatus Hecatella orcuttiae]|jgi:anaerobic dimethyl sulfoxide reductase subunit B (iron-sulfur subunit)/Tat-targeted selenate reductase subunit YnfG|uniref:4Fe-4S dicluster domain-containing protein n=1 Tax=Candidatus Hecatella orcuttiae TaxID=1935119 RepID=UPI002867C27B|nr:4Fe-4S dicluster domain-containing protein [Candidatus Hecatella orcuttiae]
MVKYALMFHPDRCVGCPTCVVACKQENEIPVGPSWLRITKRVYKVDGKLKMSFNLLRCMHCGRPPCIEACPVNAITKRSDGIVLINKELCTGCKACIEACPFKAPQYNPEKDVVEMCTLCVHRIEKGLLPSCVQHCPAGALYFGDVNAVTAALQENKWPTEV